MSHTESIPAPESGCGLFCPIHIAGGSCLIASCDVNVGGNCRYWNNDMHMMMNASWRLWQNFVQYHHVPKMVFLRLLKLYYTFIRWIPSSPFISHFTTPSAPSPPNPPNLSPPTWALPSPPTSTLRPVESSFSSYLSHPFPTHLSPPFPSQLSPPSPPFSSHLNFPFPADLYWGGRSHEAWFHFGLSPWLLLG